jgi:phosphoglycolate phosphatase-like HAD superfamily hydrolase
MIWIFDLDGVLIKSSKSARRACEAVLGRTLDFETSGMTDAELLRRTGVEENAFVAETLRMTFELHPVGSALLKVAENPVLITGNLRKCAEHKLKKWHRSDAFKLCGYSDGFFCKTAIASDLDHRIRATRWMQKFERIYVGDKPIDAQCAKILGAQFLQVHP